MDEYTLLHYLTPSGRDVFNEWLLALRDIVEKAVIIKRLNRVQQGNLGDCQPCREGGNCVSAMDTGFTTREQQPQLS